MLSRLYLLLLGSEDHIKQILKWETSKEQLTVERRGFGMVLFLLGQEQLELGRKRLLPNAAF